MLKGMNFLLIPMIYFSHETHHREGLLAAARSAMDLGSWERRPMKPKKKKVGMFLKRMMQSDRLRQHAIVERLIYI